MCIIETYLFLLCAVFFNWQKEVTKTEPSLYNPFLAIKVAPKEMTGWILNVNETAARDRTQHQPKSGLSLQLHKRISPSFFMLLACFDLLLSLSILLNCDSVKIFFLVCFCSCREFLHFGINKVCFISYHIILYLNMLSLRIIIQSIGARFWVECIHLFQFISR